MPQADKDRNARIAAVCQEIESRAENRNKTSFYGLNSFKISVIDEKLGEDQ